MTLTVVNVDLVQQAVTKVDSGRVCVHSLVFSDNCLVSPWFIFQYLISILCATG